MKRKLALCAAFLFKSVVCRLQRIHISEKPYRTEKKSAHKSDQRKN